MNVQSDQEKILSIQNVTKRFGKNTVLDEVNLDVYKHDIIGICGPSGGGKSTFLRVINGLEKVDSGKIFYNNEQLTKQNVKLFRKSIGMVFQSFNLFSNLTVIDNLLIAPTKVLRLRREDCLLQAKRYLETLGIGDKPNAYPHQLSGGQQQRVAIVRALLMKPEIMLFDEPTSALDPEMIKEVLDSIRKLSDSGMTMLIVSHEMSFLKEISTRMLFMEKARIQVNSGTQDFFNNPSDERLVQFMSVILKK